MHRRRFLSLPGLGLLTGVLGVSGVALASCGEDPVPPPPSTGPGGAEQGRFDYGDDPSQFAELTLPDGDPRGVVVVIHGGFWRPEYSLDLGRPLAASLAEQGWAAWNIEYRRVGATGGPGGGGGVPQTLDDVAAAIDLLAERDLDTSTVVTLGHSAGGHLAAWAASRGRFPRWRGGVEVTHVISQAGVLDLVSGAADDLGGGAVQAFLGREPGPEDAPVDPQQQLPLDQPVWCVHGTSDTIVPPSQSEEYVAAARAAGASAELVAVDGDHFTLIDTGSQAWARTLGVLDTIVAPR